MPNEKVFVSWEAGEEKKVLDAMKLVIVFAVILAVAIYFLVSKDWISGATIVFLALALLWYLLTAKKPLRFSISDRGVTIEGKLYAYENIASYWVSPANNTIYLIPKSKLELTNIPVMLGDRDPGSVTKFFPKTIILTERQDKDAADKISDFLHR